MSRRNRVRKNKNRLKRRKAQEELKARKPPSALSSLLSSTRLRIASVLFVLAIGTLLLAKMHISKATKKNVDAQRAKISKQINLLFDGEKISAPPYHFVVPEDERTGSDIMVTFSPPYIASRGKHHLDASQTRHIPPVLRALPANTTVHAYVPENTTAEYRRQLEEQYPNLTFQFYEYPWAGSGINNYTQNIVFATGRKDGQGRFVTLNSSDDPSQARARLKTTPKLSELSKIATLLLGDDILARDYPASFTNHFSPTAMDGGDLQVVRSPDGVKKVAIVGQVNMIETMRTLDSIFRKNNKRGPVFSPQELKASIEEAKELYKEYLGVDEVMLLDEEHLLANQSATKTADFYTSDFFDTDMIARVVTDGYGKVTAFVTNADNCPNVKAADKAYMQRVKAQFEARGYETIDLPLVEDAAFNYVNTVFFHSRTAGKTAMLPQYGYPKEDAEAEAILRSRGFHIIKVDYRDLVAEAIKHGELGKNGPGSVECTAEVLF